MQDEGNNGKDIDAVQVKEFRHTLLWTLAVNEEGGNGYEKIAKALKDSIWEEKENLNKLLDYEALVYFHPFVQKALFPKETQKKYTHIWSRKDSQNLEVEVSLYWKHDKKDLTPLKFSVSKCYFIFFDVGIALLSLEIVSKQPLTLEQVEDFQDRFRRAYPPYFTNDSEQENDKNDYKDIGSRCPKEVILWAYDGEKKVEVGQRSNYGERNYFEDQNQNRHIPPVSWHFRSLLDPLLFEDEASKISLSHIEDDRITAMSYIAFDRPEDLTLGDFTRLVFFDDSGCSNTQPYGSDFLFKQQDVIQKHFYDRYWEPNPPKSEKQCPTDEKHRYCNCPKTTRFTFTNYSFSVIGRASDWFFSNVIPTHYSQHYWIMGVIINMQRATLLNFNNRIAEAVIDKRNSKKFKKAVDEIRNDLLRFSHLFWFSEISPQLQGQEMYTQWSNLYRNKELYDEVSQEVMVISQLLDSKEQEKQADRSEKLAMIAGIALPISLFFSFTGSHWYESWISPHKFWISLLSTVFIIGGILFYVQARFWRK